jgi:hypothetical protein
MKSQYDDTERYVCQLLEMSGVDAERERALWGVLRHAYMAIALFERLDSGQKATVAYMQKKLQYFFASDFKLKERKRRKTEEKKKPFPHTPYKESKEERQVEIEQKTHTHAVRGNAVAGDGFNARREAFREACLQLRGQCDDQMLADFFNYWSETDRTGRMRFERQRFWNTERRLARWSKNHIASDNTAAAIRLDRTQKRQKQQAAAENREQQAAAVREQDNARREQAAQERKEKMQLSDEYIREHPDSLLARIARQPDNKKSQKP